MRVSAWRRVQGEDPVHERTRLSVDFRRRIGLVLRVTALLALAIGGVASPARAHHIPFAPGDVLAGVGFGLIKHFAPDGTLLEILDTTSGSFVDTGMCFDASGNLYTTNFGPDSVSKF